MRKGRGFGLIEILLIILIILVIGFIGWFVFMREDSSSDTTNNDTETSVTEDEESSPDTSDEESEEATEPELETDETPDFTLVIPEGFERIDERQFTFTGTPERTYTYKNADTGDYFEVNYNPAQSGINSDFTWTYTYTDGEFVVDKSDSTVCLPEETDWCEFSGDNGRLDSAIFSEGGAGVDGESVYFTFGNTTSETVGDLSYVDTFLENITF